MAPNPSNTHHESRSPKAAGGHSPNHRGFRPDAAAPAKKRWNADERAARTGNRQPSGDRRRNWTPREERPPYNDDRPAGSDSPAYSTERPPRRESDLYPSRDSKQYAGPHEDVVLERLEAQVVTAGDVEGKTFGDLGLGDNITRQLAAMGAAAPFPIQAAAPFPTFSPARMFWAVARPRRDSRNVPANVAPARRLHSVRRSLSA